MKNETARREIESLDYYLQNHTNDYSEESHTAMMMAIDALNNADVLDKIRAEIEETINSYVCDVEENTPKAQGMINAKIMVLNIIDKYTKGGEGTS